MIAKPIVSGNEPPKSFLFLSMHAKIVNTRINVMMHSTPNPWNAVTLLLSVVKPICIGADFTESVATELL